jgi:hypothetical protein
MVLRIADDDLGDYVDGLEGGHIVHFVVDIYIFKFLLLFRFSVAD